MQAAIASRLSLQNFMIFLIAAGLAIRLYLAFDYQANWDEFLNLSMVYDYARGDLNSVLQTMFVHGFRWLPLVSANEVDQIVAARLVMFVLGLGTAGFLHQICRHFFSERISLFAVLCYLSFSFVIAQGNSFRTDQIATCALMAAIWVIVCRPATLSYALVAGFLIGFAGMATIKAIFYVPTIGGLLLLRIFSQPRNTGATLSAFAMGVAALASFLALFMIHGLTLTDPVSALAFLGRTTGRTMVERDFPPAIIATARRAFLENGVFWVMATIGAAASITGLLRAGASERARWASLLCFALPLGSVFFYTETFAYYYVFMLAPVAVLCGAGLAGVSPRVEPRLAILGCIGLGLMLTAALVRDMVRGNAEQRQVLAVVHRMFPGPVPYIDCCSMVSSFPKRGLFMSYWGMSDYYHGGVPVMEGVIGRSQPRFIVANRRALDLANLGRAESGPEFTGLMSKDIATLKDNFIPHWGPIYVAGKRTWVTSASPVAAFDILIEGTYTIESAGAALLDGKRVEPGEIVLVARGPHEFRLLDSEGVIILRWGEHIYRPTEAAPTHPLFRGY